MSQEKKKLDRTVHVDALDTIVSTNTFFSVSILIGITGTITPSSTIPRNCVAGDDIARNFFLFEIISFGCYLLSSLVVQGMKLAITLLSADDFKKLKKHKKKKFKEFVVDPEVEKRRQKMLEGAQHVVVLAAVLTIMGTFFLMLSMVFAIQLKFGLLSCNIPLAVGATFAFSVPVAFGLVSYGYALTYALKYKRDYTL